MFAAVLLGPPSCALGIARGGAPMDPRNPHGRMLLAFGWTVAGALLVVVPTVEVLALLHYLPMLVGGAPFGWPPVDYSEVFSWPLINQAVAMAGGVLVAGTVLPAAPRGACAARRSDEPQRHRAGIAWQSP